MPGAMLSVFPSDIPIRRPAPCWFSTFCRGHGTAGAGQRVGMRRVLGDGVADG